MSMTGFDYYSASVLAAYIADISRFPSPSHLVSWVGLCPSVPPDRGITLHGKDEGRKQEGQVDHDPSGEHSHQIRPENESVPRTEAEEAPP